MSIPRVSKKCFVAELKKNNSSCDPFFLSMILRAVSMFSIEKSGIIKIFFSTLFREPMIDLTKGLTSHRLSL